MITYEQFQEALKIIHDYKDQLDAQVKLTKKEFNNLPKFVNINKDTYLDECDCSVRLYNIIMAVRDKFGMIRTNYSTKVGELSKISITELRKQWNVGAKSIDELKELCKYAGVELSD